MGKDIGKLIGAVVVVGIGAWVVYEIFKSGTVRSRSMTPEEARRFLKEIYRKYLGDYILARRWVAEGDSCRECREAVERLASKMGIDIGGDTSSMSARELLVREIRQKIDAPPSILFYGPPGVGKSETVRDFAEEIAAEYGLTFRDFKGQSVRAIIGDIWRTFAYVDLRLTSVEPADLMGIPRTIDVGKRGKVSRYLPFDWAFALSTVPGVLFLDELTNVKRPDVLSAAYQLVLDRKSGFVKFDPGVMVIAAGNPPKVSAVASKLPGPLLERFDTYHIVPPTVDEWRDYMNRKYGDEWCKLIYYYLKARPASMIPKQVPARALTQDEQFPAPRGWTRLAIKLHKLFGNRVPEVMAKLVEKPCSEWMNLKPGDVGYDYEAKMMCEAIASSVGIRETELIPYYVGFKLPNAKELLTHFDKFEEWFNRTLEERISKVGGDRDAMARAILWGCTPILADALEDIIEKEGAEGVKKFIDDLAKLVDFLEKYDVTLGVLLMTPICKRRDEKGFMEIKMMVYERSPKVREHVKQYIEIMKSQAK